MNILFVTATRIGDAVLSTGVLRHLVERYPDARFTIACGPLAASLFAAVPRLDRVIVVPKRPFDQHWFDLWRQVRGRRWDLVVDLRRSLLSYFLRARQRRIVGAADNTRHRVAFLPSVLGVAEALDPHIFMTAHHHAAAATLVPAGAPVLAVAPVASLPEKTWPGFANLMKLVVMPEGPCVGWRVAVFGGPGDEAAAEAVLHMVPHRDRLRVVAEPDLLTVAAALARCTAYIGNDSGLSHLAAAVSRPALAVFGATEPRLYAPWGPACAVVRSPNPHDLASLPARDVAVALAGLIAAP